MRFQTIAQLDATGLVRTACTERGEGPWKHGEFGAISSYERIAGELGVDPKMMVRVNQKHTANVHVATKADAGRGIYLPHLEPNDDCALDANPACADFSLGEGIDGLVTNERGLTLCTLEADCVPVFLLDPIQRAIGMVHSGWRGTAARISARAIALMKERFGTDPRNLIAALGPCICGDCYEVGPELRDAFESNFSAEEVSSFFTPRANGKYLLDVPQAVRATLMDAQVPEENTVMPFACTYEDERFSSYRRDHLPDDRMLTAIVLL